MAISSVTHRLFLGILEAIVTPGMTILTSIWYSQSEVPFRSLIWYSFNGWAGIFGGFVAYGVSRSLLIAIYRGAGVISPRML